MSQETVTAMVARLGVSESAAVQPTRFMAAVELPTYEADDGPLSVADVNALADIADRAQPRGKLVNKQSLF